MKNIIITGASKGLGSVAAKALADEGNKLVLIARSGDKLEKIRKECKNSDKHLCISADLTDKKELQKTVAQAKKFLGDVDIVLHVVGGGLGMRDDLVSGGDLEKLFSLNVSVAAGINSLIVPDMIKRGKGNLVHVCSIASVEATGSVGYNTVKAALAGYVRTLGNSLAGKGIVATGILPGAFYGPENSWERLEKNNPEVVKKFIKERLPRNKIADASELVPLLKFLCSDGASMMGGCLVPIDAGEGKSYL